MDTFTHCITGAVIAKAGFNQRLGRIGTVTGAVASFVPDADILMRFFGQQDFSFFIKYHRGPGNSLFFMIPLSLVIALIFNVVSKKKAFAHFFLLSLLAIAAHNFMDLQTSYGTMLLFPFSNTRFTLDLVFILDLFYSGILLSGFLMAVFWKRRAIGCARITLLMIALYTGLCAINHWRALSAGHEFAKSHHIKAIEIASLPQPLSPFLWTNFVESDELVYRGFLDLWGHEGPVRSDSFIGKYKSNFKGFKQVTYRSYAKFPESPLLRKAFELEGVKLFLWFARFPIVLSEELKDDFYVLKLFDLRFDSMIGGSPFVYEIVFDREGNIKSESFKRS